MTQILAWNRPASVVLGSPDHSQRERTARDTLARFRAECSRHAGEREYEEFHSSTR
jgi:hypothetical protein